LLATLRFDTPVGFSADIFNTPKEYTIKIRQVNRRGL
jgi:hypothetical protein